MPKINLIRKNEAKAAEAWKDVSGEDKGKFFDALRSIAQKFDLEVYDDGLKNIKKGKNDTVLVMFSDDEDGVSKDDASKMLTKVRNALSRAGFPESKLGYSIGLSFDPGSDSQEIYMNVDSAASKKNPTKDLDAFARDLASALKTAGVPEIVSATKISGWLQSSGSPIVCGYWPDSISSAKLNSIKDAVTAELSAKYDMSGTFVTADKSAAGLNGAGKAAGKPALLIQSSEV